MPRGVTIAYGFLSTVIIASFVAFFVVLQPQLAELQANKQQLHQTQQEIAAQEAFLSTIDQKLQGLQANQQHENQLALILPAEERSEDFLRIINQVSNVSGVTIGNLSNQSTNLQGQLNAQIARGASEGLPANIRPVGWEFDFSGTYQQYRTFLQELERAPRLVDILKINLTRNQQDPNIVSGRMTTQFYQYVPPNPNL